MEGQAQETPHWKLAVTGGRAKLDDARQQAVWDVLDDQLEHRVCGPLVLIHGGAYGVDNAAMYWAKERGILTCRWDAPWVIGPKAGPIRNGAMVRVMRPDLLLSFPGGKGTENCTQIAHKLHIPIIFPYPEGWPV